MRKKLFFVALAAFALIGCQTEQSELDLDQIKETAHVEGQVVYSLGQDTLAADYQADRIVPAVGRKVFIEVDLSQYNSAASGKKIFEGTTDSTGMFKMDVPVPSKGVNATLRLEEFTAERTTYLKMENGKPVFETRMCKFEVDPNLAPMKLLPGKNFFLEETKIMYHHTVIDMKDYSENVVLSGTLKLPVEKAYMVGAYEVAKNVVVELEIVDGVDNEEALAAGIAPVSFTYGFETNDNGEFSANLPIKDLHKGFQVKKMVVLAKGDKAFKHFLSNGSSIDVDGAYKMRAGESTPKTSFITDIVPDIDCALGEIAMEFIPYYNNGITTSLPEPEDWNPNLVGWVFGTAEYAEYAATKTLSGVVYQGVEKSFAAGEYIAAPWKVEVHIYYTYMPTIVTVKCDAKGAFTLDIPVKGEDDTYNVNVFVQSPANITFEHFKNAKGDKAIIKEGYYTQHQILKQGAEWNELGDFYMVFNPTTPTDFPTYNSNLLGWLKVANFDKTASIKGTVMLEKETAFLVGANVPAEGRRVQLGITDYPQSGDYTNIVLPINADGSYEAVIPVESETKQYAVSASLLDDEESAYTQFKKENQKVLEGTYSVRSTIYPGLKDAADAVWNDKGIMYYQFASSDASFVTRLLPIWFHEQGKENKVTVKGKVSYAIEKSFGVGDWKSGDNEEVKVTVDGHTFNVLVKNGAFSFDYPVRFLDQELSASVATAPVDVEDFKHFVDNKGKTQTLEGQYTSPAAFQYKASDAEWYEIGDIFYIFTPTAAPSSWHTNLAAWALKDKKFAEMQASAIISAKVMLPVEKSYAIGDYVAAANRIITFNVAGDEFDVLTDATGAAKLTMPLKEADEEPATSVSVPAETEKEFVHFKAVGKSTKLEGKYVVVSSKVVRAEEAAWNEQGTIYCEFKPDVAPATWEVRLAGWQKFDPRFANKDITATGSIRLAQETGFWKGTYVPGANKRVLVSYDLEGTSFKQVVLTSADGAFECPIYRHFGDDEPAVSAQLIDNKVDDFVHYYHITSPVSVKCDGQYSLNVTDKAATAKYYVCGTKYYKFAPSTTPEDWQSDLVGWYVCPQKKATASVQMYAQRAVESTTTGSHEAKWENCGTSKVRLTINGLGLWSETLYTTVSGNSIAFSLPVAVEIEDGVSTLSVAVNLLGTGKTVDFKHYEDPTKDAITTIRGQYVNVGNVNGTACGNMTAAGTKFTEEISAKMYFNYNGSMPTGWSSYDWTSIVANKYNE